MGDDHNEATTLPSDPLSYLVVTVESGLLEYKHRREMDRQAREDRESEEKKRQPSLYLKASIRNTHPHLPCTFLTWSTPIDPVAHRLGVFVVTPVKDDDKNKNNDDGLSNGSDATSNDNSDEGTPVHFTRMYIRRIVPPESDSSFQTLASGETATRYFELGPSDRGACFDVHENKKYRVRAQGRYHGVWLKSREEISAEDWEGPDGNGAVSEWVVRDFMSDVSVSGELGVGGLA